MPNLDKTQLRNLTTLTFEDFKALNQQGQNRADVYYKNLKLQAQNTGLVHVQNYADMANNVVNNSNINGVLANNFTNSIAESRNVDFSPGSNARLEMQYNLMVADAQLRISKINAGGSGELNYQDTLNIHAAATNSIGLPPEGFSLYTPLSILAEHDPARAQFLFQTTLANGGVADVLQDGLLLGFGANISSQQSLSEILQDYGAQAAWLKTNLDAMQKLVDTYPGDASEISDRLETYKALLALAGGSFELLANWADHLPDGQSFFNGLPAWIQNALNKFNNGQSAWLPPVSPLVLDLDGDGIELTAVTGSNSVYFDMNNDGNFKEATGWVTGGDGLLAMDRDNNGTIDNQSELFGNSATAANGFLNLKTLDSNGDNKITSADAQWSKLRVWVDENSDGVSQAAELKTLAALGITSVNSFGSAYSAASH